MAYKQTFYVVNFHPSILGVPTIQQPLDLQGRTHITWTNSHRDVSGNKQPERPTPKPTNEPLQLQQLDFVTLLGSKVPENPLVVNT